MKRFETNTDFNGRPSIPCPVLQGFSEKYCPNVSEARRFLRKPAGLDLAGQSDTGLPLSVEIRVGSKLGMVVSCVSSN